MATQEEDDEKDKLADEEAEGSPDDVIAGPDAAPVDPQIMTMTGVPQTTSAPVDAAAPGGGDPRFRRGGGPGMGGGFGGGPLSMLFGGGMGGHGGPVPPGAPGGAPGAAGPGAAQGGGFMPHGGMLGQIFQRIQQAQQQRAQHWAQSPQGQQFIASPQGQAMAQQHPNWPIFKPATPTAPATPAVPAANIVEGDHTGEPGPAATTPTAAEAAQQAATQAPAAGTQPAAAAAPTSSATPAPAAPQQPRGVRPSQRPQGQRPVWGGNASASIQDEIKRRLGGGGGMSGGGGIGGRRMF